jgi:ATP-dependent helicase IRC3
LSQFDTDIKHPEGIEVANAPPHKIPIIGFSATFSRHDGVALGSVFERIVYHRDFLEMIKEQWCVMFLFMVLSMANTLFIGYATYASRL